jgi:hypothetical protein
MTKAATCYNSAMTFPGSSIPGKSVCSEGIAKAMRLSWTVRRANSMRSYIAPERFEFLASYEGRDLAIQGGTVCINFFVVRNVPADSLVISEGKPLLVSPPELSALVEKLTPTTKYALKAFFKICPPS